MESLIPPVKADTLSYWSCISEWHIYVGSQDYTAVREFPVCCEYAEEGH
jgi:hypothetical protein